MPKPDARLRQCSDEPAKRTIKTDGDTAALLVELFAWGRDCASKLSSTWKSIDDAQTRADELNKAPAQ